MVVDQGSTQPIVPLGRLIDVLGCKVEWKDTKMTLYHPRRGLLRVENRGGCPHVTREEALRLIQELEEAGGVRRKKRIG